LLITTYITLLVVVNTVYVTVPAYINDSKFNLTLLLVESTVHAPWFPSTVTLHATLVENIFSAAIVK